MKELALEMWGRARRCKSDWRDNLGG